MRRVNRQYLTDQDTPIKQTTNSYILQMTKKILVTSSQSLTIKQSILSRLHKNALLHEHSDDDSDDQVPLWCCAYLWMACRPNLVTKGSDCLLCRPNLVKSFPSPKALPAYLLACLLGENDDENVKIFFDHHRH